MPLKTKSKKTGKVKSSAVVDALSTEEMSKDQLEEHIIHLREELDREREERSYFQLERDKIHSFWEISKRNLEEAKAQLRNRQKERDEAMERHRVGITEYKQKLKHVLSEHHNITSGLKMDGVASTSLIQNQYMEAELTLQREKLGLQADFRKKQLHNQNCIKELKLKHQVELLELTNSYGRRIRDVEAQFQRKMQAMIAVEDRKRRAEINQLENRMKSRVVTLVDDHSRALREAEEFYSGLQIRLLGEQKELKEELAEATKQQMGVDRELSAAWRENKQLSESLQESQQNLSELQFQQEEQAKAKTGATRAQVKVTEKALRDLTVKHELLLQACEKVQQERDELLKKQTEAILDVQQKSGLKQLLLERKLVALTETVEKKEAQLCTVLSACSVDQTAASHVDIRLKEIFESKQAANDALQCELAQGYKEYDDLLQTCEETLKAQGIPLHDFPFKFSEQIVGGH